MMTSATVHAQVGDTAMYQLPSGDTYIGEIVETFPGLVVLRNYAAWYEGDTAPYNSPHLDDEVRFAVDAKTVVDVQATGGASA